MTLADFTPFIPAIVFTAGAWIAVHFMTRSSRAEDRRRKAKAE